MAERCDLTDLLTDQCGHCRGHVDPVDELKALRHKLLNSPRWFPAVHTGTCGECGERFPVGAAIRPPIPGALELGWIAECCADREESPC